MCRTAFKDFCQHRRKTPLTKSNKMATLIQKLQIATPSPSLMMKVTNNSENNNK